MLFPSAVDVVGCKTRVRCVCPSALWKKREANQERCEFGGLGEMRAERTYVEEGDKKDKHSLKRKKVVHATQTSNSIQAY